MRKAAWSWVCVCVGASSVFARNVRCHNRRSPLVHWYPTIATACYGPRTSCHCTCSACRSACLRCSEPKGAERSRKSVESAVKQIIRKPCALVLQFHVNLRWTSGERPITDLSRQTLVLPRFLSSGALRWTPEAPYKGAQFKPKVGRGHRWYLSRRADSP